jgi:acyl-CoA reductase-like NAD-dependent aldehyde dehydrogenase
MRIRELMAAAKGIAKDEALRDDIAQSTGLTRPNVDRAFERHLELEATDADLAKLVERAGQAEAVTVVLSANVFVGALRAFALAIAASQDVKVRPSRRDPAFARALATAAGIPLIEDLDAVTKGELHVYGKDETIADIRKRVKLPVKGHGAGMGVVIITKTADLTAAARSLADDVVIFDQRGCLSPRIVFVDPEHADAFAESLHDALEDAQAVIPRGDLPSDERAASARYIATMTYGGRALIGTAHAIGVAATLIAAPAYRHVHVIATNDPTSVLMPIASAVTTVGSNDLAAARTLAPHGARTALLGEMQRPPLDGPVDLRVA